MESIATQAYAHCFQRNNFVWRNITQVYITAKLFKKVQLLLFFWCFPQYFFSRNLSKNFIYQALTYFAAATLSTAECEAVRNTYL